MDFAWSEEQIVFRQQVMRFAREELNDDMIQRDLQGEFSREGWRKCAKFGIQGLPVPLECGGGGADALTVVGALETLGYSCRDNGLLFSLNTHMWGCEIPILLFGTDEQKKTYLPKLMSGEWIGVGMSEPVSGFTRGVQVRAARRRGGYVLNGLMNFVTNATHSDLTVVLADVDSTEGSGNTAFVVEKGTPGFTFNRKLRMGLRTSPMAELSFADCEIPAGNLLGKEGNGPAISAAASEWERICVLASYLGTMQRLLETSLEYARERKQFGQPIGKFTAVAEKIADMAVRLESSRLLLYNAAWLKAQGKDSAREASIAKLYLGEACIQSCLDAMQIHGGYGYMIEYQIERELRDAISARSYSTTSEVQRMNIASLHGL